LARGGVRARANIFPTKGFFQLKVFFTDDFSHLNIGKLTRYLSRTDLHLPVTHSLRFVSKIMN